MTSHFRHTRTHMHTHTSEGIEKSSGLGTASLARRNLDCLSTRQSPPFSTSRSSLEKMFEEQEELLKFASLHGTKKGEDIKLLKMWWMSTEALL